MIMINLNKLVKAQEIDDESCTITIDNGHVYKANISVQNVKCLIDFGEKSLFVEEIEESIIMPPVPPPPKEIGADGVHVWKIMMLTLITLFAGSLLIALTMH